MYGTCRSRWSDRHHSRVVKRLKYKLFERLLLEKWKWFGRDDCEMCVESRCLSFAYGLSSRVGKQVQANMNKLKRCQQLTEKEPILHFLLLMGSVEGDPEDKTTFNDSGVCMSDGQESLFENVPRLGDVNSLHSAITSSQRVRPSGMNKGGWDFLNNCHSVSHVWCIFIHFCSCLSVHLVVAFMAGVLSYHWTRIEPHPLAPSSAVSLTQELLTLTKLLTFHDCCQTSPLP